MESLKINNISNINAALKKGVLNNKKYTLNPIDCKIKINQNESPFDLPKSIKRNVLNKIKNKKWNIYPDFIPEKLYKKIADSFNVKKENILIGNGSNEMISTILTATLESGKKVIIPEPTFTVYKLISSNLNANITSVTLNDDFTYNVDKFMEEAKSKGSVTVICSPNNPTGTFLSYDDIKKIVDASRGIVIVDEAYIHFGGETVIDLIKDYDNLILLRTFSKAFGLAGLRIGMMIGNENIIGQLSKVKLPYNINIFSIIVLEEIFKNLSFLEDNIKKILTQREYLENSFKEFNKLEVIPTSTNFFLVRVKDSKWLFNELLKFSILVRDVSNYPMLNNCLRISVGSKNENQLLVKSLRKIYKKD